MQTGPKNATFSVCGPDPGNLGTALRTASVPGKFRGGLKTLSANYRLQTVRTLRIDRFFGDIAQIDIAQAFGLGDGMGFFQREERGRVGSAELIVRVKAADVPWNIGIRFGNETHEVGEFLLRAVSFRNDQGGYFQPDTQGLHASNGIQHRLQAAVADLLIKIFSK
jgi:hypothetical protein